MAVSRTIGTFSQPLSDLYGGGSYGGTGTQAPASTRLAEEISRLRAKGEAREEEMYGKAEEALKKQEEQIEARYQAGLMSEEEKQSMLAEAFETTRAQFGQVGREFAEGTYGDVNIGAFRAGARDIKMREAGEIGRGVRDIGFEQVRRRGEAETGRYAGLSDVARGRFDIARTREYQRPEPLPTFREEDILTAISAPRPVTEPTAPTSPGWLGTGTRQDWRTSQIDRYGKIL